MRKKNECTVLFLDLHIRIKTKKKGKKLNESNIEKLPSECTLNKLFDYVLCLKKETKINKVSKDERTEIYLADIEKDDDEKCWKLLINYVDTSLADEVHKGIDNDFRKENSKTENVGTEFSSHLIIKAEPEEDGSWLVLCEKTPKISISRVREYFNFLLKKVTEKNKEFFQISSPIYTVTKENTEEKINFDCICSFQGHPSDEFIEQLNQGTLKSIMLISKNVKNFLPAYDFENHVDIKEMRLPIKIDRNEIKKHQGNDGFLKKLMGSASELKSDTIKIVLENNSGSSSTINLNPSDDLENYNYVKKVRIRDLNNLVTTSVKSIDKSIINKMLDYMPAYDEV